MSRRVVVALLVGASVVVRPTPARACQPGPWTSAPAYAAPAAAVPKNIPAIYVFPGWTYSYYYGAPCKADAVGLTQSPSTPIALTPSASEPNTYLLSSELEEGASYLLDYSSNCPWTSPAQIAFKAAEARPFPLQTGKLEVIASGAGSVSWWDGACNWGVGAAWVRLRLRPSCDLVPFLPVTRFVAEANGSVWWSSAVGSTSTRELADSRTVDLVWAPCGGGQIQPGALPKPGNILITMKAHVVGAPSDPEPAQLGVVLSCDGGASTMPPPQPDGGMVDLVNPCISSFDA